MNVRELRNALNQQVGKSVSFKKIVGTGIILYFDGEPGDATHCSIWLEAPWRYEAGNRVVFGSSDLSLTETDFASKQAEDEEWHSRCRITDAVIDQHLEEVAIDPTSNDLTLRFSGEKVLRNFSNTRAHEELWTYRDKPNGIVVYVSSEQIEVRTNN